MAGDKEPTLVDKIIRWIKNNPFFAVLIVIGVIVTGVAAFVASVVSLTHSFGLRKEVKEQIPVYVKITLTPSAIEALKASSAQAASPAPVQRWNRLDSDTQQGFYQTQLPELSQKLTAAHVAPDGVKFMFGIGRDEPHRGWMSVFVREGDNQPFMYDVKEEKNNGQAGAVQGEIINKLKDGPVIPIGWTYKSESFIYATAELH